MAAEQGVRVVGPRTGAGLGTVIRAFVLLLCFAARGGALYFHIGETEKKCFIEEIPDETMVIGAGGTGEFGTRPWSWGGGPGRVRSARAGSNGSHRVLAGPDSTPPRAPLTWLRPTSSRKLPDAAV